MTKYSLILPYYNRASHLYTTLVSYRYWYAHRTNYEILIGEDWKNVRDNEAHAALQGVVREFSDLPIRQWQAEYDTGWVATFIRNRLVDAAQGTIVIQTNPECFHKNNILEGFDQEYADNAVDTAFGPGHPDWNIPSKRNKYAGNRKYVVCACEAGKNWQANIVKTFADLQYDHYMWYQHTQHKNRALHWCTAMPKSLYMEIGGFDEYYTWGMCYDDDDLREKIRAAKIPVKFRDDLVVVHLEHDRDYQAQDALQERNHHYYIHKWGADRRVW